jgi:hypothetical protein
VEKLIALSTWALQLFAVTFGIYHAVLGFLNLRFYEYPQYVLAALLVYLSVLTMSVFFPKGVAIPSWLATANLVSAIVVPLVVTAGLGSFAPTTYTTWYVAAIATLLAITAVRGHKLMAWIGVSFLVIEVLIWGGIQIFFTSGIVGAILLVLGGQAASRALDQSADMARKFRERATATQAATEAQSAARQERERRITQTLAGVLPQLEEIVKSDGKLSEAKKKRARLTEAALRDQIRGRALLSEELIVQTENARSRGVEVQLLDDGGFDDLEPKEAASLLERAASELEKIQAGKVVIRTVPGEKWKLTMVAIRKGEEMPDLFLRL